MRVEVTERTILEFEELTEEQKTKVYDKFRDINTDNNSWYEWIFSDYSILLDKLGFVDFDLSFSGFCSQGDGASFTANFNHSYFNLEDYRDFLKDYPNFDDSFISEKITEIIKTCVEIESPYYSGSLFLEDLNVTRNCPHYVHENSIYSYFLPMQELARHISSKLYQDLETEYYYQQSDSAIKETIDCNEFEFYSDTLEIA